MNARTAIKDNKRRIHRHTITQEIKKDRTNDIHTYTKTYSKQAGRKEQKAHTENKKKNKIA